MRNPSSKITSHYVSYEHARRGRKGLAICGELVAERDQSNEPTCRECQKELDLTAEQAFGPQTSGTQVTTPEFNPTAGYRLKGSK